MKTLTIFTPTYNREELLAKLYKSLCNQTSKDFIWMVIDDGSTDKTRELVQKWKEENLIEIEYYYKENGGMHTGHNLALKLIQTELNMCIDSDDYMPTEAVGKLLYFWEINKNDNYAGILGLDSFENGNLVSGKPFPTNIKSGKYFLLKKKYGLRGDVKFVYRTDVIKRYPDYPVFDGEKLTPLGYKYRIIDQHYDMLFFNEVLCIVEYMPDGSSKTITKQYFQSPNGFRHSRLYTMKYSADLKEKFIQSMHFVKESIISKNYNIYTNNSEKFIVTIAIPFGILLYLYLKLKLKRNG